MFHILFPYKLFVSLSSRACKGSRIGTINALTLSSPNTVNEYMLQMPQRGWPRKPQPGSPAASFAAGLGAGTGMQQMHPAPLPTGQTGQKLGYYLRKLWPERRIQRWLQAKIPQHPPSGVDASCTTTA